jgi:hypothetical protein
MMREKSMKKVSAVVVGLSLGLAAGQVMAKSSINKVIYGDDNRVHAGASNNPLFERLALSTAAMIKGSALVASSTSPELLSVTSENLQAEMNVCADERFAESLAAAMCSGFLVAENLLVTAGHCVKNEADCESYKWAFDYRQDQLAQTGEVTLKSSNVYSCKRIISRALDPQFSPDKNDYALLELDRPVPDRAPLTFRKEGKIELGAEIVVIGHPSGLPTIISDGASVRDNASPFYFQANLDTFGGNSGSAVFDAKTGVIEGILVRGERDYIRDPQLGCMRPFQCENDQCRGEDVTRITVIPELAPGQQPTPTPYVEPERPEFLPFPFFIYTPNLIPLDIDLSDIDFDI